MAPKRMIDFLRAAEAFHRDLGVYYKEKSQEAQSEDVKIILTHLSRHEESVQDMIARYEEGADQTILDAWFKVSPDMSQLKDAGLGLDPNGSTEEIIQQAIQIDDILIDMYRLLVREALDEKVKDALNDLIQEEVAEEIKLMRAEA